jgi:hypothetical protein
MPGESRATLGGCYLGVILTMLSPDVADEVEHHGSICLFQA